MENEDFDFESAYNKLKEKYDLPEFKKLAEDFDIEKSSDKETNFLLREIRRTINEKLSSYLHLFETLMNPSAPPMFVFSFLRGITESDKETIKEVYKRLSRTQIDIMKIDTVYSEVSEAKFIKSTYTEWQELKKIISNLIEEFESNFDKDNYVKKGGYFG
jgi:hypothetical protein